MKWYKIFTPELKELIESKNLKGLSLLLKDIHPADIADIIRELEPTERVITLRVLNKTKIAEGVQVIILTQDQSTWKDLENLYRHENIDIFRMEL